MKVRTLGLLAALGMTLTSLTVWSVTAPGESSRGEGELWASEIPGSELPASATFEPAALLGTQEDAVAFSGASFTAGTTLELEARLGHARLSAEHENETLLYVGVQADPDATSGSSAPSRLNLTIVIDRSGSMEGKRLANALDAARGMIRRLRDGDVVSVITYSTGTETVLPPTDVDSSSRERALGALERVTAQGNTCISCGIEAGLELLAKRTGMVDRMLLLSDGEATAGVRELDGFRRIAERCRNVGASISAIGVDVDYNEQLMSLLALESNGRHHFVDDPDDLSRAFDDELATLVKSIADDAELVIELAPGVELDQVYDRSFRRDGSRLIVPLGSFSAGDDKTLLVRVRLPAGERGERRIADVRLAFADLGSGRTLSAHGELSSFLVGPGETPSELDPIVATRAERAETTSVLRDANKLFNLGRASDAREKLAARLSAVNRQRAVALGAAPAERSASLKADFDGQALALNEAEKGFGEPRAGATPLAKPAAGRPLAMKPPAPSRKSRAQVKQNAARADAFAY